LPGVSNGHASLRETRAPATGFGRPIRSFAEATLSLQSARHSADYDPLPRFDGIDAANAISVARAARMDRDAAAGDQAESSLWLLIFRPRT
jgi:hypothetical protein